MDRNEKIIGILCVYKVWARKAGATLNGLKMLKIYCDLMELEDGPLNTLFDNYKKTYDNRKPLENVQHKIRFEGWSS